MSITICYKPASLMRRLFAALLDGVLIGLFGPILIVGAALATCSFQSSHCIWLSTLIFPPLVFTEIFGFPVTIFMAISILRYKFIRDYFPTDWPLVVLVPLLPLLISSIYHGLMESLPIKATLGKLVMGIFVSDLNGNKISFMHAMSRYLARGRSTLTCGLGYLMALGETGQALHDKITGCSVLSKERFYCASCTHSAESIRAGSNSNGRVVSYQEDGLFNFVPLANTIVF